MDCGSSSIKRIVPQLAHFYISFLTTTFPIFTPNRHSKMKLSPSTLLFAAVAIAGVVSSNAADCGSAICTAEYNPLCGSDGNTYSNKCMFDNAQCKNTELKVVRAGACAPSGEECKEKVCVEIYQPVCASDNKTYGNKCELENAQCKNKELKAVRDGACESTPSMAPVLVAAAAPADACMKACPRNTAPVCGSDGKTYSNKCMFEIAQCETKSLKLVREGRCDLTMCKTACPKNISYVCGSDGVTYANECLFKNAQCDNISLKIARQGQC